MGLPRESAAICSVTQRSHIMKKKYVHCIFLVFVKIYVINNIESRIVDVPIHVEITKHFVSS